MKNADGWIHFLAVVMTVIAAYLVTSAAAAAWVTLYRGFMRVFA